ncbi:MAG: NAD(P)-dependent oxidoreductase [SAR324 cluster bacterium]|nr:NAD(P)-dependent oxidoreductase [SAR324 cluster bacterium]
MSKNILITGMSGLIGGLARQQLEKKYSLTGLNRSKVSGVNCLQADLSDLNAIRPAFKDQEIVIHLAAKAGNNYSWQEFQDTNITGTYNVFEAAVQAGVQRVIFASSGATVAGWEKEEPFKAIVEGRYQDVPDSWPNLDHETLPRPSGIYGATKVWGEALGRQWADSSDLSVINLRIGHVMKSDKPVTDRDFSVWCSQGDVAKMIETCVEAPAAIKHEVFYVISENKWGYRDMEHAKEVLGFEAQDAAENFR